MVKAPLVQQTRHEKGAPASLLFELIKTRSVLDQHVTAPPHVKCKAWPTAILSCFQSDAHALRSI